MNYCIKSAKLLLMSLACAMVLCACQKDYFISITTLEPIDITESSAVCQFELLRTGNVRLKQFGICWSKQDNPSLSDKIVVWETCDNNIYSCNLCDLESSTQYYVRAFVCIDGETYYGDVKTFITKVKGLPEVKTKGYSASFVNGTGSVVVEGMIVSEGDSPVIERGFFWGTTPDLSEYDSVSEAEGGIGIFSSTIPNLDGRTPYYYRAYATNSIGTTYGEIRTINASNITFTVNDVSFSMIRVWSGSFQMGAQSTDVLGVNYDELADDDESPVHKVTLYGYHIGETEVTQELWEAIMGSNPSLRKGADLPVENVSWNEVQEFISRLNVALVNNLYIGFTFRLPTEAEWEYAACGGGEGELYRYSGSDNVNDVAWYRDNSGTTTHEVKSKLPNAIGIYGMSGNVREWCQDRYGSYPNSAQTNPVGDGDDYDKHIIRGGGWYSDSTACRNTSRDKANSTEHSGNLGFRLVY